MSQSENQVQSSLPTNVTASTETTSTEQSQASTLLTKVSESIKNSNDVVKERLTSLLVEREIVARVELLDKALAKLSEAKKELGKLKPDQTSIAGDGTKTETYSKEQYKKREDVKENLDKLNAAVQTAMLGEGPEPFKKLKELVK